MINPFKYALFFILSLVCFGQDKGYYAAGFSGIGPFAVIGTRLNDSTSAYANLGLAGTTSVSAGVVRTVLHVNALKISALGEAGAAVTGDTGFAGAVGGVVGYDISKWVKVPGVQIIGVVKIQKTGDVVSSPVYGIGLSKSF